MALNAVLALGLVGAGTNNARLAGILRQLSAYYYKEPTLLFVVRVAQVGAAWERGWVGVEACVWSVCGMCRACVYV